MSALLLGITPPRRKLLLNAAGLLSSGAIAALSLLLLTSQRVGIIDASLSTTITLFVQWQALGLTVAKMGLDVVVFAVASRDPGRRPEVGRTWLRLVLPLALIFGALSVQSFGILGAAVCASTAAVDSWSAARIAWEAARKRFDRVVIANLLNYPLFFAFLFAASALGYGYTELALLGFLASSLARFVFLWSRPVGGGTISLRVNYELGLQQGLNYLLFKGDQMALSLFAASLFLRADPASVQQLLFLSRFPDLIGAGTAALAGMILPHLFVPSRASLRDLKKAWHLDARTGSVYVMATLAAYAIFLLAWHGPQLTPKMLPPFLCSAMLVLPANALTFSMLRENHVRTLIRNLLLSVFLGAALAGVAALRGSILILAWAVPIQLASFVCLAGTAPWLGSRALHD